MSERSLRERLRSDPTGAVSTAVTAVWMAALFTHQDWWLGALLVGYVVVVPATKFLFGDAAGSDDARGDADPQSADDDAETPLETLRRRYAEGELTEAQFERKLERLLETETVEDAEDRLGREREPERER